MPTDHEIEVFQEGLCRWAQGEDNIRQFSWREKDSPYKVLVAEVLLGATLASKVEPIYDEFIERYPSLEDLAEADVEELATLLEPLGLHNRRAAALVKIGNQLKDSGVPVDEDDLLELPYVGQYAANATLCFGFGERRAIVDANVVRIYNRIFNLDLKPTGDDAREFAERVLPDRDFQLFNLALLDFGAAVCTDQSPRCSECFFSGNCYYYSQL
jgi:A/G-specific adenine glycosylase